MNFEALEQRLKPRLLPTLEPFGAFLKKLGNPHTKIPPVLHIAGTNGKGSTLAILTACYEAAGYTVHRYTSPHLLCYTERFYGTGHPIGRKALYEKLVSHIQSAEEHGLSWFELLTAVAFELFRDRPADIVLLETGLGGEADATNVIETPLATLISPIGLDHCERLGMTLKEIALAKAGILKPTIPCLTTHQFPEVLDVLKRRAHALNSPLLCEGYDWISDIAPSLRGMHQIQNAGLALAALRLTQQLFPISDKAIQKGLLEVKWPGRLQVLEETDQGRLWFDVAHNEEGAKALSRYFDGIPGTKTMIFNTLLTKDAQAMMTYLAPCFDAFIFFTPPKKDLYHDPQILLQIAQGVGRKASIASSLSEALQQAGERPKRECIVAGSHTFATELARVGKC
jgi:dihydrofolate synthase/folylpolyglutamate synthase